MGRIEWLEDRKKGIGGSDVGAILGHNQYRSRLDVWMDKTGRGAEVADNYAMAKGRALEPVIRQMFCNETGLEVSHTENETKPHPKYKFLLASIDGYTSDQGILEIKTMNRWVAKKGEIPKSYYWQIQHYMFVYGCKHGYFAVDADGQFLIEKVPFDETYITDVLPKLNQFWQYVTSDVKPPAQKRDNIPPAVDDAVNANEYTKAAIDNIKSIKDRIKDLKAEQERYEDILIAQLDGHSAIVDRQGKQLVTYKQVTSQRFDSARFKKEQAETYQKYVKAVISNRLTVK